MPGEASRRNGRLGRGPRTPAGRERSSRNALRHGLSRRGLPPDPAHSAEIEAHVLALTGGCDDPTLHAAAHSLALADLGVRQVRAHQQAIRDFHETEQDRLALVGQLLAADREHAATFLDTPEEMVAVAHCEAEADRVLRGEVPLVAELDPASLRALPVRTRADLARSSDWLTLQYYEARALSGLRRARAAFDAQAARLRPIG